MTVLTSPSPTQVLKHKDINKAYISLSKGKSSGYRPVYDLWIFKDGTVIYDGIENVKVKGRVEIGVSGDKIDEIETLVIRSSTSEIETPKGRDMPLTILKYNNRKVVYQSNAIKGNLLKLNDLLDDLRKNI